MPQWPTGLVASLASLAVLNARARYPSREPRPLYYRTVSTRTIWILRASLEGLSYVLLIGATGVLGTQHPTWFLMGGGVKLFLSSLLQQVGNVSDPNAPLAIAQGTAAGK